MSKRWIFCVISCQILAASILFGAPRISAAAELSVSCGALGVELELCQEAVASWSERTGHEVEVVSTPHSSSERLALYQQILTARADDIDVFQVDVVWPGLLGQHFIDLSDYFGPRDLDAFFPALIDAMKDPDGRLVAIPWHTDAGVLYYREDLLDAHGIDVPETWAELDAAAEKVQAAERAAGNADFWGYVFQGQNYEGLTCNALEWVHAHNGGTIVAEDGAITVDNQAAVQALELPMTWTGRISPRGVLNYTEEESRGVFQSGNAAFMRNWPYAWALAQSADSPIRGKVGVVPLPKGGADGRHAATLGGWNLAVSKYTSNPEAAIDLVRWLTGPEVQKTKAIRGSYNPTRTALYEDPDVLEAAPLFGDLYEVFTSAVARPSSPTGESYNRVSNAFATAVHNVIAGQMEPAAALQRLDRQLKRIARGDRF